VIEQPPTLKMLKDLDDGLKATKRDKDWGMSPGGTSGFFIKELKIYFDRYYEIKADLYNDNGVLIGSTIIATKPDGKEELPFWSKFTNAPTYDFITDSVGYKIRLLKKKYRSWMNPFDFNIRKEWYEEVFYAKEKSKLVFTVKADSITDKMIIKIANINEYVASMDPEGPFIKKKSLLVVELILFLPTPLRNKFFAWRNAAWRP
jgi:hypothetical protein